MSVIDTIRLVKPPHLFIIRYERGHAEDLTPHLMDMVHDPRTTFDWFDAAVVSNRLGITLNTAPPKGK
jgi:hypothetical protein